MPEKKKILYICPNGYLGGAEKFVLNIVSGHQKSNKFNTSVLFFSTGDAYDKSLQMGATTYLLPFSLRLRNIVSVVKTCLWLRRLIKDKKFDVIHSTMPYAHIILSLSSIFLKIKRVWFQHGPVAGFLDQIAILTPVNTIYFNSTYLEKIHLEMPFAKTKKLKNHIVNLGIAAHRSNESELKSLREKYLSSNEQILISNVGRICKGKGQKNIIESIYKLKTEAPNQFKKIKLLIIGDIGRKEDNDYKLNIISLVKKYQLEEHIIFIGQTNEVEKYYQASDIYISSSLTPEPFGLTIIEAMINKSLVITDNKGGLSNYLINQETCVTYNSAEDVAKDDLYNVLNETIQQFTDHPEKIKLIKKNAFEMAHTNFSIESMTKNIEDSYQELLKN